MKEDFEIIEQVKLASLKDFEILMDRYKNYVMSICVSVLKDRHEAEEATQDSFVKAYKAIKSFDHKSKFSTWIYKIAYRTSLDYLRKRKKTSNLEDSSYYIADSQSVEKQIDADERKALLVKIIMSLPEEEAALIRMFYMEELQIKDLIKITGLSESNVKTKLFRIRKKLRKMLSTKAKEMFLP